MNIHEHMGERMQLAGIYAQDGAFRSAARILRDLGDELEAHADACDSGLEAIGAKLVSIPIDALSLAQPNEPMEGNDN